MVRFLDAVQAIAVTLWVGALWTSGLVVAPLLFQTLSDRTLAGTVAGRLFEVTAFIGLACGISILIICFVRRRARAAQRYLAWLVAAMLVLVVIGQFGIQPVLAAIREQVHPQPVMDSALGPRFAFWHMAATLLYLCQCLLGAALVIMQHTAGVRSGAD
ncbi:MAG: DUF4149 domain-containing protein [Betaproteobacteria bacterium]|nr:MAG: DUF4149 domain-containing protein [Betaproteobacteria bacterium]